MTFIESLNYLTSFGGKAPNYLTKMNRYALAGALAISIGLIIDDIVFIRTNFDDPGITEKLIYNSTLIPVIWLIVSAIILVFLIKYFLQRNTNLKRNKK